MKRYFSKCLHVGIFLGMIFLLVATPIAQAENNKYKSLQTDIVIRSMTKKEKLHDDKAVRQSKKNHKSGTEKFVDGASYPLAIIAGSGQAITDTVIDGAKKFSTTKIANAIKKVKKVNSRTAHAIVKTGKGNLQSAGKYADVADKVGTFASVAGSASGGDWSGVAEGFVDGGASGLTASATSAGAVFLAGAASTAIYGAPLGPVGMAVTAAIGGVVGSVLYNEVGAPIVRKAGDLASNKINNELEKAEKIKRRVRVDYTTVYPHGAIGVDPKDLEPERLKVRAAEIREERKKYPSVPSTYGLDRETAKQTLISAGFSASVSVGNPAEDSDSEGKVYAQNLKAGTKAELGTSVSVVIYGKYISITTVPNAIGLKAKLAGDAIRGADLIFQASVGDPAEDISNQFKAYSQNPVAGTEVNRKTPVNVLIYGKFAEKEITVPSVKGLSASEAQILITERGLTVIFVKGGAAPDPAKTNTVKSQTPGAGTIFKNKGVVILTVYAMDMKNAHCQRNEALFSAALEGELITRCHDILSEAVECPFYPVAISKLKRWECLQAQFSYDDAVNAKHFRQAKSILARYGKCEFALGGTLASLQCEQSRSNIDTMLNRNDMGGVKSILSHSQNCSFYPSYMAALAQAEKSAVRNKKNQALFWQMLGGALAGVSNSSSIGSNNSSGGNSANTGPPVIHQGTCNDVRKAGGDRPERHIIDIGRRGRTFRFDYQTYDQEDMVIVSQGGRVLFNSGCVGTGKTKTIILKKSYGPKVTVDIRPNCKGGSGTAWEFKVHCPE